MHSPNSQQPTGPNTTPPTAMTAHRGLSGNAPAPGLRRQRKHRQRQQQLQLPHKHCRRRCGPIYLDATTSHWQATCTILFAYFALATAGLVATSTPAVSSSYSASGELPQKNSLQSPLSPDALSGTRQQQQRQLQQQHLFALLKPNGLVVPPNTIEARKTVAVSPFATKSIVRRPHRRLSQNANDSYDDGYSDEEMEKASRLRDSAAHSSYSSGLMETRGFVSDDAQQFERGVHALSDSELQHRTVSNNNNPSCPKECKCLNVYFDCGKKHLDRVPHLPAYVQIIDLIGNKLNDTTVLQISNLPDLNRLVLKRNQLESLPKFVGLSSLKHLSLSHNRIQNISPEALALLPKLKTLDLSKNYLHSLESGYFPKGNRLAHLILNGNEISSVEENAFENLPELHDLELNNNHLTSLPAGVFKSVNKLRKLGLNYNQLEINWSTFRGLTSLQKLFLKSNNIRALQDGVFHVMRSIETIELDHNEISSLNRQGLFNLTRLHHLSLSNNTISRIELDTWEFTQSLVSLDLSHNNITEFQPQHLDCLQHLKHLNLAHNKIQFLMDTTFDCVKNLEELNLRRNKLSWIIEDPGAAPPFKALRKLKKLDLYGNNLKHINTKSLSGLTELEFLNLGGNALASLQDGAFDHMVHLQKLIFNSLNFICDCDLLWFKRWLARHLKLSGGEQQQSSSSAASSSQAVCGFPENLLDRELLSLKQTELLCAETPKPKLTQEPSNQLAVKGTNITMECRATSPRAASFAATDELKIRWRHDNHNIKEKNVAPALIFATYTTTETQIYNEHSNNQTTIIGYLRLFNVSYESAGKYQCVVSNAFGTTYSQKFKISIGIHPSFLQVPSNLTVDSGDTARLVCSATGDPTPVMALQKFGASDFPAAIERRLQVLRDENAFVITNAKPTDSGVYTCTADSAAGEIKVNASLVVNDKPQPSIPVVRKEIVVGKSSVLECLNDVASDLNQPNREWYKDNKPFHITPTLDSDRYYFTAEKELLIIVNTQSVDSGSYRCEITDSSKTYVLLMELLVVKEDLSQNVIIVGIIVVTAACVVVGSLVVWLILFYQKKKMYISAGQRSAAAHSRHVLTGSRISTLDQTQMTTLSRNFLRAPHDQNNQRPRSMAELELNSGEFSAGDDEGQPLTQQRSCLVVASAPNHQQLLMQRSAFDSHDDDHFTMEYITRDGESQQDYLSSKDSGTGSDAANKRSIEDFGLTGLQAVSTPTPTAMVRGVARNSLAGQDSSSDLVNSNGAAMPHTNVVTTSPTNSCDIAMGTSPTSADASTDAAEANTPTAQDACGSPSLSQYCKISSTNYSPSHASSALRQKQVLET